MAKLRIGVLYDYWWDEDEERVEGERPKKKSPDEDVHAVYEALKKSGYNPVFVRLDGTRDSLIDLAKSQTDLLFNMVESFGGDDSQDTNVAGYLELLGRRFTGAGSSGLGVLTNIPRSETLAVSACWDARVCPKCTRVRSGLRAEGASADLPGARARSGSIRPISSGRDESCCRPTGCWSSRSRHGPKRWPSLPTCSVRPRRRWSPIQASPMRRPKR